MVDHLGPLLALSPVTCRHSPNTVLIVDGTLVSTHDRLVSASNKNYRYPTNLQVVIDAHTRLVAVGRPLPGNRNDCRAYAESGIDRHCAEAAVMADAGYQGTGNHVVPQAPRRQPVARLEGRPQPCPPPGPGQSRTRPGAHEVLEHLAQLLTQGRRRLPRHLCSGPHAQPRHDRLTGPDKRQPPPGLPCPTTPPRPLRDNL